MTRRYWNGNTWVLDIYGGAHGDGDRRIEIHHILGQFYAKAAEDQFNAADWATTEILRVFLPLAQENAHLKANLEAVRRGLL